MSKDPILAFVGEMQSDATGRPYSGMVINGGLHYIKGNSAPYFTLTCTTYKGGRDAGGGADHEEILRHRPDLKPLADLHLSSIDGVPMHAEANGWYWLAGTVAGGFGQRHHGGTGSGAKRACDCLRIFANHVRISHQEAADLRERMLAIAKDEGNGAARSAFDHWIGEQRPRWKAEADACIQQFGLVVFGDAWKPSSSEVPA